MELARWRSRLRVSVNPAKCIKRLRLERGLSQRELAEGLDHVSYAFISRLENGGRGPSSKSVRQLATNLGTTAYYLETGKTKGRCPHCGGSPASPETSDGLATG